MRITLLPHARERMEPYGVSEDEVRSVLEEAGEEGAANFSCRYSQRQVGHRLIRMIYNQGRARPWWSRSCYAEGKVGVLED